MIPLIDADILLHEIGWSCEFKDKHTGEEVFLSWEQAEKLLSDKVVFICEEVGATEPPIMFLTESDFTDRYFKRLGNTHQPDYEKGFRYEVAKTKPYKGTRKNPKPFYFYSIAAHILANYNTIVSHSGLEADDMMSIYQCTHNNTIICSRDKDLRICPGWHYSWECGTQRSVGPAKTDKIGWLEKRVLKEGTETTKEVWDILGYGLKFFYYQMLVGDTADNIPGLKGWGKVAAYNLLTPLTTEEDLFREVKKAYVDTLGKEAAKEYFMEQANLLWLHQKYGEFFKIPVTKPQ